MPWWLLLFSCEPEPADAVVEPPADEPWHELPPVALEPFFLAYETGSLGTTTTARLRSVPGQPALVAFPRFDGSAAMLDGRYQLQSEAACVALDQFPELDDGVNRSGGCGPGYVSIDRGRLAAGAAIVDVGFDSEARELLALDAGGAIRRANADITTGNPYDFYRLGAPSTSACGGTPPSAILAGTLGSYWLAGGSTVCEVAADGGPVADHERDGTVLSLLQVDDHIVALTAESVWLNNGIEVALSGAARVAPTPEGDVWVSLPTEAAVAKVSLLDGETQRFPVAGLTGPLATDLRTGKLYVAVEDGVAILYDGVEMSRHETVDVVDIIVNDSHEISVLGSDSIVHVYVDETALVGAPPLPVWVAAFIENPRQEATEVDCSGSAEGMEERVELAHANRHWLDNTPATVSIAVTPAVGIHARRCDQLEALQHVVDRERSETGVLLHDAPEDCTGQSCIADAVEADLAAMKEAGISVDFLAGGQGLEFTGDWVMALLDSDAPPIYTFFGLWVLSNIGIEDPRAKDAWPWDSEASTATWRAATADRASEDDPSGELLLVPGGTLAGFNYDACAGLLQVECRFTDGGGQSTFSEADGKLLALAIRRAAAHRPEASGSSWSFHLPAIEAFDYLVGCAETDGVWSGEGCQAAVMQAWSFDVHTRLVENGIVTWSLPSMSTGPE